MKRFLGLIVLASCMAGHRIVTLDAFYEIDLSTPASEVVASLGKPYAVHNKGDGCVEYEYIERIKIGARYAEERRYYILMRDGVVISKRVKQVSPLPYGLDSFDSYDMQTTQSE